MALNWKLPTEKERSEEWKRNKNKKRWAKPGIEPGPLAPKARILPLNYFANIIRLRKIIIFI
jgi:hypothetical protein